VESGGPSVEKVKECDVASWHLNGCSLCLCRLRTDELAPTSNYWTYRSHVGDISPVSLVVSHQQKVGFALTASLVGSEEKLVTDPGSVSRHAVGYVESPFSQQQWPCSTLLMTTQKVAMHWPHKICMVWGRTWTKHRMRVACWSNFPYNVYIDSNNHDSQIWVPLVRVGLHVAN
jgi:hypothetical protein